MNDDPNGIWYKFIMNGEKNSISGDSLTFQEIGKVFAFKDNLTILVTEYKFLELLSPDANFSIDFQKEKKFNHQDLGNKSSRDK